MIEKTIRIGEKGQITIPKSAREKWLIKPGDNVKMIIMPSGTITIETIQKEEPEDRLLKILDKMPGIDAGKAWKRIEKEREKER